MGKVPPALFHFTALKTSFWRLELIRFRAPKLPLAMTDNTAESLFGFAHLLQRGVWVSYNPAEGPDYPMAERLILASLVY